MKKSSKLMVISTAVSLFTLATGTIATAFVNASTKNNQENIMQIDQIATKQLSRAGYVFRLSSNSLMNPMYRQAEQVEKYSKTYVEQLVVNKILFKVTEVNSLNKHIMVHIIDQSGKYQGWVSLLTGIYNVKALKRNLKPLVKAEFEVMRIKDSQGKKAALKELIKVEQEIKRLPKRNKEIGENSLLELQRWLNHGNYQFIPSLMIGQY
ncbi:hypothetical protein SAMN04487792_1386 [Lactobacillus bombicola]|uniref:Uncharacterized protein n=1 Tax=Lactobacillus bombicola TaxID=1505723 RepID=A0A1I1TJV3_9LACO|nr:hypothetical protein [Lactobacillus bombicola]MCO6527231.1 hypothetical protein [Lactobacillus sp.]SFD56683.1 hypothetical protein SAMN04487792_1386 [Lactobacillus bombicola]